MTHASLVVAAVAVLAAAGCRSVADGAATDTAASAATVVETNAVIERVVDGDTVDVVVDGRRERVRLIGIDTPETKDEDGPVECYGPQATAATSALLPEGTPIRLERDVEPRTTTDGCSPTCSGAGTGCSSTSSWPARARRRRCRSGPTRPMPEPYERPRPRPGAPASACGGRAQRRRWAHG